MTLMESRRTHVLALSFGKWQLQQPKSGSNTQQKTQTIKSLMPQNKNG
jgi:hypothetical protein